MRVPDSLLISSLIAGEVWRRASGRIRSGPLYRWRFTSSAPSSLTMAPQDLRPADSELATQYYSGHFTFGMETVSTRGDSPFSVKAPSDEWFAELHRFRWLRHLRSADTDLAHANAAALVSDWIDLWGNNLESQAWQPDIVAARLIAWFCHAPLLVKRTSSDDYRKLLKSMARQSRYLRHKAPHTQDGYPRLQVSIALAYVSLCFEGKEKQIRSAARDLDKEIERQILPDGGHISRNPVVITQILADLLPLIQAYSNQGHSPSPVLMSASDKMMGALRFFRHSNGDLAQFNGTGFTPAALLATILRYDASTGKPQQSAPQSGYERMDAGKTVVIMDTGKPANRATAHRAMAGTLSFELSFGATRFIANCGVPEHQYERYAPYARATAAHSTITINDVSSSLFVGDFRSHKFLPSPLIRVPEQVSSTRSSDQEYNSITASHDGYLNNFGLIHQRSLFLSKDGSTLNGIDELKCKGAGKRGEHTAALRFHLPPTVSASLLTSGHSILIAAPNKEAWTFTCIDGDISLEESIQFSGPGEPRKSEQIVVYFNSHDTDSIRWVFERRKKKPSGKSKQAGNKLATPDLLDTLDN